MKKEKPNSNRGGKREGAGPGLKYGEPTVQVNYAVPETKETEFREMCDAKLKTWEKPKEKKGKKSKQ